VLVLVLVLVLLLLLLLLLLLTITSTKVLFLHSIQISLKKNPQEFSMPPLRALNQHPSQ
jgi:hypothetical protein